MLLNNDMAKRLAQDELSAARAGVLWLLRRRGQSTQRELAQALEVSARNVTGLVDGLEGAGLVSRETSPADRRVALVTLTGAGLRIVEKLEAEQQEFADILFGGMPPEQFEGLVGGLDEVVRRLREQGLRVHEDNAE